MNQVISKTVYRFRVVLLFGICSLSLSGCISMLQPPQKEASLPQMVIQSNERENHPALLSLEQMEQQLSEAQRVLEDAGYVDTLNFAEK